ncbi:DegT/DnrJ/EryC1/StrS family aminotransferase [Cellulomonas soli]
MSSHDAATVTSLLAQRTGTDPADWFLVLKARYGMQVVLQALADTRGPGEVVTQVFTCATAVDPVLVAGLRPVYAEVAPRSVAVDPDRLGVGAHTRAVVLQHTFGIVDGEAAVRLAEIARSVGALVLEDSAHCVGRLARDAAGEPVADVSVHSFGVEKMLPTRFGGAVWVNPALGDRALRDRLVHDLGALPVAGARVDLAARTYRTQLRVLTRLPKPVAGPLRSLLTRARLFDPAIAPVELRGGLAHPPLRPSAWVVAQMAARLPGLEQDETRRAQAVEVYLRELGDLVEVPAAVGPDSALVRFPFFASDAQAAERVLDALARGGVYAGRWYRPALFPGVSDPALYGYTPGDGTLAVTEALIERVVNLPTGVDVERARHVAALVRSALG